MAKIKCRRNKDCKHWDDIHGFHLSNHEAKDIFLMLLLVKNIKQKEATF